MLVTHCNLRLYEYRRSPLRARVKLDAVNVPLDHQHHSIPVLKHHTWCITKVKAYMKPQPCTTPSSVWKDESNNTLYSQNMTAAERDDNYATQREQEGKTYEGLGLCATRNCYMASMCAL